MFDKNAPEVMWIMDAVEPSHGDTRAANSATRKPGNAHPRLATPRTMDACSRLLATRPAAHAYRETLAQLPQSLVGHSARIAQLAIFPVKGLGALRVLRARVEARGLVEPATGLADRGVMLAYRKEGATPDGARFEAVGLALRNEPALARTSARLSDGVLVYEAPLIAPLRLAPGSLAPSEGQRVRMKLPYDGSPVLEGVLDEGPLAVWARELLRANPAPRRFSMDDIIAVRWSPSHERAVSEAHRAGEDASTLFSDGGHVHVASTSTLAWMNDALAAGGERRIDMDAFRPNVVLDGLLPNAEDLVREIEVQGSDGRARLILASLCVRCDATRVDAATGTRPDVQPLAWLARNRPARPGTTGATFGVNGVLPATSRGAILQKGDEVRVMAEQ